MPRANADTVVGFRNHWPSSRVKIRGVMLRDVLASASATVPEGGAIIVRSKPAALTEDARERRIDAVDVASCGLILAMSFGDDDRRIAANMGGPVVLAFGDSCRAKYSNEPWPVYVEEIEIVPR